MGNARGPGKKTEEEAAGLPPAQNYIFQKLNIYYIIYIMYLNVSMYLSCSNNHDF